MYNYATVERSTRYQVDTETENRFRRYVILTIVATITALVVGGAIGAYLVNREAIKTLESVRSSNTAVVRDLRGKLDQANEEHAAILADTIEGYTDEIAGLNDTIEELNNRVETVQQELDAQLDASMGSFGLYKNFWWVLKDASNNSGITMEAIAYSIQRCKDWDINPMWLWHIYQVETHLNTGLDNAQGSGARGLGQVMPATGRSYWEDILGHGKGSFSVEMLYDPMVNIDITCAHLGRDLQNGSSWYEAVNHYSGGGGQSYYNEVISYAAEHGITLSADNYRYPW